MFAATSAVHPDHRRLVHPDRGVHRGERDAFAYLYQRRPPLKASEPQAFWSIANGGELVIMFCFASC